MIDYAKVLNPVARDMKPSGIRKFFEIAATRKDCISLGVGEPDFITPHAFSQAGIDSILCTPSCTPPRWMLDKYEEMRGVDSHGVRAEVSSRCHPCKTSPLMREKNAVIVEELAKAFGAHPGVIGYVQFERLVDRILLGSLQ